MGLAARAVAIAASPAVRSDSLNVAKAIADRKTDLPAEAIVRAADFAG